MSNPVGTILTYYGTQAPEGYFPCDGSTFDPCVYRKLFKILGEAKTPDLRGYFIRGLDSEGVRDPDGATRKLNDEQGDAIRNITGQVFGYFSNDNSPGALYIKEVSSPNTWPKPVSDPLWYGGWQGFDASRAVPTAPENRPVNKAMLYCIKHDQLSQIEPPSHIKAWGYINEQGQLVNSYNIAKIEKFSSSYYWIDIANPPTHNNYLVIGTGRGTSKHNPNVQEARLDRFPRTNSRFAIGSIGIVKGYYAEAPAAIQFSVIW